MHAFKQKEDAGLLLVCVFRAVLIVALASARQA